MRTGARDRDTGYVERSPRVPYPGRAHARVETEALELETLDLSSSGVAVAHAGRLRVGAWLVLTFSGAPELVFSAQVVRRWRQAHRACAGLVFTRIPRHGTRWLNEQLRRHEGSSGRRRAREGEPRLGVGATEVEPESGLHEVTLVGVAPSAPMSDTTDSTVVALSDRRAEVGPEAGPPENASAVLAVLEVHLLSDPTTRRARLIEGRVPLLQQVEALCQSSLRPIDEAAEIDARLLDLTPHADEEALVEIGAIRRHLRYLRPYLLRRAGVL